MRLPDEAIAEFKAIMKKEKGIELSDEEAQEQGNRLLDFFKIIYDISKREYFRHQRLKKEPKGFFLEEDGSVYNCLICHNHISGKTGWWDEWGQKCLDCLRNVQEKVIPPEVCKNRDLWFADWELKSKFNIHSQTARKLRRLGKLKGRELKTSSGATYFTVHLIEENRDFIREKIMEKFILTPASPNDALEIQKLLRTTWLDTYGNYLSQATLDEVYKNWQNVKFLTKQIENPEMYFPTVKYDGQLLGIATARKTDEGIMMFRLYVYPQYQRRGVGKMLLETVINHYPEAEKIQLHVEVLNEKGQAFYKKQGFKEIKREQEKVVNEVIDQILMEKELI